MFSEVYWHHTVRSATAMLQRAFYLLRERLDFDDLLTSGDGEFVVKLARAAHGGPAGALVEGLFGAKRRLYKRLAQFSFLDDRALFERLARRSYDWLVRASEALAHLAGARLGRDVAAADILFDAPPVEREVEFNVQIYYPKERRYRAFADVSPVVRTLAQEQFDDYVKRVRIFANPEIVKALRELDIRPIVEQAIEMAG
jgi:HD superfamily phosphohydrolase